jgi:hypothetical protein
LEQAGRREPEYVHDEVLYTLRALMFVRCDGENDVEVGTPPFSVWLWYGMNAYEP